MSKLEKLIQQYCPDGVNYVKLGDIAQVCRGVRVVKNQLSDSGYPVYQNCLTPMGYYDKTNCPKGTSFVICGGAAGNVGYTDVDCWAADDCEYIQCDDKIVLNRYIYYYLTSNQHYLMSRVRKASIPRLSPSVIKELVIPVPPLPVQEEIVRILDTFTELQAELQTELQAELQKRIQQYNYYRDNLINQADGKKGKLLNMLSQPITDGPHTTPQLFETGVPFVSATAVYDGKVHLEDAKGFISPEFDRECAKKYKPRKHDVFMVKSGSTTGKVAYVDFDDDFNVWSPLAAMRTNKDNSPRYLYHLLQTTTIQQQVQERMSHGSQPNLSMRVLEQFDVVIPSLEEQERLLHLLDRLDVICNDLTQGLPAEIEKRKQQYEYYRDKLLTFKRTNA